MIITCVMTVPITYTDKNGVRKTVVTRPGSHDYPMLDHKDPVIAEQLRVYRKHGRIGFDELLETDLEILKKIDPKLDPKEKAKALLKEVSLKPSPVGRIVKKGKKKNDGGDSKKVVSTSKASGKSVSKEDTSKGKGPVS